MSALAERRLARRRQTNEPLRAHVTRVGFDLTLGRTHIAALVYLSESIRRQDYLSTNKVTDPTKRHAFAYFASGMGGCVARGLVLHHYDTGVRDGGLAPHYSFTRAGKLVVDLLRESGLYDEYAGALPEAGE